MINRGVQFYVYFLKLKSQIKVQNVWLLEIKYSINYRFWFSIGYGGTCPPIGHSVHRYNFTVYALDVEKLNIKKDDKPKTVENEILKHVIAKSTIIGLFERKQINFNHLYFLAYLLVL